MIKMKTKKRRYIRGNCRCIATWGHETCQSFSAFTTRPAPTIIVPIRAPVKFRQNWPPKLLII